MLDQKNFFTVSELNTTIREVVNMGFPQGVWVCGEIQGFNRNRSKNHIFFELCEKDPLTKDIIAKIGLVLFSGRKNYINEVLKKAENAFILKDDIEVKFLCKVDFYPPHGAMRLIVESIDPVYTLGKIAQEKQRLIALLREKGILDKNKEREVPLVPLRVGLITAYDSAAYNDFLDELTESGFGFKVFCRNALMQGKKAEGDVCRALKDLNKRNGLDVIVITRGGGSIADLSCFDSEKIARAVAASKLPVLSGIGHEINITITDLAAHVYQKTPTAIAQLLVEKVSDFLISAEEKFYQMIDLSESKIKDENTDLKRLAVQCAQFTNTFLRSQKQEISRFVGIIQSQPKRSIGIFKGEVTEKKKLFKKTLENRLRADQRKIGNYERLVSMADPVNTIKRGFAITRTKEGELLRDIEQVAVGDGITTRLANGIIQSKIEKRSKKK